MLELNCQAWHYSLTEEDTSTLERVQKVALKIIYKHEYESYENALNLSQLKSLKDRRTDLCLKFAKRCTRHPTAASMFPKNLISNHDLRRPNMYYVQPAKTDRLKNSAIPQLQRALNKTN